MKIRENEDICRILADAGLLENERIGIDWWLQQRDQFRMPIVDIATFLRESWRGVAASDPAGIDSFLQLLRTRMGDDDFYQSRELKENPDLLTTIQAAMEDPVLRNSIAFLVRSAQIEAVFSLIVLMDGGEAFEGGNRASWGMFVLSESDGPGERFGDMKDLFWYFDPENRQIR